MNSLMKSIIAPLAISVPMQAYNPIPDPKPEVFEQQEAILNNLVNDKEEVNKIMSSWFEHRGDKRAIQAQSSIDSVAYRRLFEGTELAKDSNVVAEFNKIAKNNIPDPMWGFPTYAYKMDEILQNNGISKKEIQNYHMENQAGRATYPDGSTRFTSRDNYVVRAKDQFKADSVAYQRFFENHKMLNSEVKKGIKEISKKFKPVM